MDLSESRGRRTAPGARIGDYVLERALGSGAMGSVFVGRHVTHGARHALKVLHLGAGAERRERFAREARALARVDRHPGVIRIHHYDVEPDGLAYCALDHVEGTDLERLLEEHPRGLPVERALALAEGLARALAHVHAAGIVHRDLKPANVLLPAGRDAPVLTDFGVARDDDEQRLTLSQQLVGTPHYMAPEQVVGDRGRVGPATDVFALGVVLHRLLTGALPFDGDGLLDLIRCIADDDPAPPSRARPDVPRDVDALVALLLDKDPARRPAAADAAQWLARARAGEPLGLPTASAVARVARLARRRDVRLLALAAAAAVLLAALAVVAQRAAATAARRGRLRAAAAEAQAEALRLDLGRVDRLLARAAPDVAPLASARAAVAALADAGDEAGAALAAVDGALARAAVEEALARQDAAGARALLARTPADGRALLEARLERTAGALAARPGLDPRTAAALRLLAADEALGRGDPLAARAQLLQAREPALAAARRGVEVRVEVLRAAQAAAAHDAQGAVAALRAAATLDPGALADAGAQVAAAAAASPDARRAADVLRALRAALPGLPLPAGARPFHALALEALAVQDAGRVAQLVDDGWQVDPATPPPAATAPLLSVVAGRHLDEGRAAEGYAVMLHAVRAGRPDPLPMRRLVGLRAQGVLDAWVSRHPDDWAGRYVRADATAELGIRGGGPNAEKALDDLRRVLAAPGLPPAVRAGAELLQVDALTATPGHVERIEALLARGHLYEHKLCDRAANHFQDRGDRAAAARWVRRIIDATRRRIEQLERGEVDVATHEFFDGHHQLRGAYERLCGLLVALGRVDEVERLPDEMAAARVEPHARAGVRAQALWARGRAREALEAARECLAVDPANNAVLRVVKEAEARLREGE